MSTHTAATPTATPTAIRLSLLVPAALAIGGCSYGYDQDFFDYDREQSRTRQIFEAQYAQAAREDAALRSHHFDQTADGPQLNGLGRERLDHLARSRAPGERLEVWVDVPPSVDPGDAEQMVVVAESYLRTGGVDPLAIVVAVGPSPALGDARDTVAAGTDTTAGAKNVADLGGIFGE